MKEDSNISAEILNRDCVLWIKERHRRLLIMRNISSKENIGLKL